jgi:hypothetical protein
MRYTHVLLLLALVGWLGSGASRVRAQETPTPPVTPPFEATANPGTPPTPQFTRVAVVLGADGLTFRVLYDPAWIALFRPQIRVGRVRTEPQPETETAPRLEGGANELQRAIEQALDRAQPSAAPSP